MTPEVVRRYIDVLRPILAPLSLWTNALNRAHRRKFLLSGLLTCGCCGGGYTNMAINHRRPLEPIGNIPPAEAEVRNYAQTEDVAMAA